MDISGTTSTTSAAAQTSATSASDASTISADFETFLKMLTTQLENQDPLNPVESSEFAMQLATFSGVEQQVQTNTLLANLSDRLGLDGLGQVGSWVGMEVRSSAAVDFDGTPIELNATFADGAERAELVVRNAAGSEVQRFTIDPGQEQITWAGVGDNGTPLATGVYSFEVVSIAGDEVLGTTPAESFQEVREVGVVDGAAMLVLSGGSSIAPEEISGLRAPEQDEL